jgi:acyl-CoA synthetase (AMP-forming)/AMP-acid ligase II
MVRGFHERFGVDVVNLFGSSEGGSLVSGPNDIPDPQTRAVCFPRWGVAGIEWASAMASRVETRLVDVSTGSEITVPGQAGELRFRGPGVFGEYFEAPEATAAAFDELGYYRSGDLFEIAGDRNQYYRFVGRCKDLVIRGGVNISPEEVEGLLASHPALEEVSVIGYADAVMGEKLCAVLVPKTDERPSLQALRSFLRDERQVAEYKLPERIEWTTSLPRNAMGKVLKRELRRLVQAPAPG